MRVLEERLPEEGGGNKPGPNPHPALGFPQLGCEKGVSEHRLRSEGAAALTPCPANLPSAAPSGRPRVRTPGARCDQAPGGSGLCHRPTLGSGTAPSPAAPVGALANQQGGQGDSALLLADPAAGASPESRLLERGPPRAGRAATAV